MTKITLKDKHFWKIIALLLIILNLALLTILLGLIFDVKISQIQTLYLTDNTFSKHVEETYFGNPNANITMIIYSDFECPFSQKFQKKIYQKLQEEYIDTSKVKVLFRHFPNPKVHKSALIEAEAFECAKEQNKSYEIYPFLYSEKRLTKTELLYIAETLNIEIPQFEECLYLEKYKNAILLQKHEAEEAGITITPTVIIDGTIVEGVKPYFIYKQIIDEKLNIYGNR